MTTLVRALGAQSYGPPIEFARSAEFSEGPVFDYDGNFFFTHGRFVTRVAPDGSSSVWTETTAPRVPIQGDAPPSAQEITGYQTVILVLRCNMYHATVC